MKVTVLVGTAKGGFLLRSDGRRKQWSVEGPLFKGWKISAATRRPDGMFLVATSSFVYGSAVYRTRDFKEFEQVKQSPRYAEGSPYKLNEIWTFAHGRERLYAGVDEAALFSSTDGGETWQEMESLTRHPTRASWFPGYGGLCCHAVIEDPGDPRRLYCGISAVGVFRSDDGGASWRPRNEGVQIVIEDKDHKDIGYCVHALVQDPAQPRTLYRQEHRGMFRTRDGGDSWERIEEGLPSSFGFPLVIDRNKGTLYSFPLESDEYRMPRDGAFRVYRSRSGGDSWEALTRGLPQKDAYAGVLRSAMALDHLDPCGVYVGSTAGTVYASADEGDTWTELPGSLPRILTVQAFTDP